MDLGRAPAGEGATESGRHVASAGEQVDGQSGGAAGRTARRRLVGDIHPDLGESPRFVETQLAAPHVGGVIHLDHHVREVMLADHQAVNRQPGATRIQVRHLVRLQDAPLVAAFVAQDQVHAAVALDGGATYGGNHLAQGGETLRWLLVRAAGRLAHLPGGFGVGVPVLVSTLVGLHVFLRQAERSAAGELRLHGRAAEGRSR